ncbi:hypothetical protein LUZ60_002818 [Juncus effusus]|nr:hypothetical protein LUZ60_002818 [Juncus effusus]
MKAMRFSLFLRSSRHSTLALTQTEHRPASASRAPSSSSSPLLLRFSFLQRSMKSRRHSIMEGSELDRSAGGSFRQDPSSSSSVAAASDLSSQLFAPGGDRTEAERYLRAVDELHSSVSASGSFASSSARASALESAMARLEDEFRHILVSRSIEIDTESLVDLNSLSMSTSPAKENSAEVSTPPPSSNSIRDLDLLPPYAIEDLRNIASRMVSNGYGRESVQVYGSARKPAVNRSLRRLGIEKLSIGDVQLMDWEALEIKIERWIQSAGIAIRVIFSSERNLCRMIFDEEGLDGAPFSEAVKGPALQLLGFAEAIAISRRSPEKLFKILDLHNSLSDLLLDISAIFNSESTESISLQAEEIVSRLAYAVRGILSEFENTVLEDSSETPVPSGTVHPLTVYVINYISLISDYKQMLMKLITTRPSYRISGVLEDLDLPESEIPLAAHLVWIIFVLHQNLKSKSRLYKDAALSHLFIMNNLRYIMQKVKDSPELTGMIGDGYLRKLKRKLGQAAANYQRATWTKILNCLRDEGLHTTGGFTAGISEVTLKERFKAFNASFQEAHRIQSLWLVPDTQLKEELKISISEKILPAYFSFLGRFRQRIQDGKHPGMYIKYSVEDLELAVLDFFEGVQVPLLNRRKSL